MPYSSLPPRAFWKSCRSEPDFRLREIHQPAFPLTRGMRVATAGSCFAQNVRPWLEATTLKVLDAEPAPAKMDPGVARRFGYGLFSARYGNIYTARQLRQLLADCMEDRVGSDAVWERSGRWFDALRPGVEPEGLASVEEVLLHRRDHLRRVLNLFASMDLFIFTLGLTEAWEDTETGRIYPSAPGVIAGQFDPDCHRFVNFGLSDTLADLTAALALLRDINPGVKVLLTVSPVPLTATATGRHVLAATTYSKSVLRAVAGEVAATDPDTDYFPAYEIVAGTPFGPERYRANLRNVSEAGIAAVMGAFFAAYSLPVPEGRPVPVATALPPEAEDEADEAICEDALLEAFAGR
ncbi:GSCFA domain-containing protein [Chachezhania sediminis]|uniref:GSCFA domain-containing protein n=1 Tax=Chachezhania sediminis TaxID=2599291 RepID=UPI00131D3426|nr:GSCFA domain-containing protein [Chachezhania sediminis]